VQQFDPELITGSVWISLVKNKGAMLINLKALFSYFLLT